MSTTILLPGDEITPDQLPPSSKKQLRLGPGLRHVFPSTIEATVAGALVSDAKKNAVWLEYSSGRYLPAINDLVIATVHHTSADLYHVQITPHAQLALLPQLAFEAATKKTKPNLTPGSLVYARVTSVSKHTDVELECIKPETGKAGGLGPLKGGMVFDVSLEFARRLMMGAGGGVVVLEDLAEKVNFEVAIGRNGRVWVDGGEEIRVTIAVGRVLREVDERGLNEGAQRELVKKVLKSLA